MRKHTLTAVFGLALAGLTLSSGVGTAQTIALRNITLEHPNPAFPYYHFRAEIDLPAPAMLEVEASVDGVPLRHIAVRDAARESRLDRPLIHTRPVFADSYARSSYAYRRPYVVGWVAWRNGSEHEIVLNVRAKQELTASDADLTAVLEARATAPEAAVFDPAWQNYKALVLTEAAGLDRVNEPVEVLLAFYADQAENLANDLRVAAVDPATREISEMPSQVFDIKRDVLEGDPRDPSFSAYERSTYEVQIWVPTVTARVVFQADVPANSSKVYLVYHNNPDAAAPRYESALSMTGPAPGLTFDGDTGKVRKIPIVIENDKISVALHPHSGVLDELTLKSRPAHRLFHKMETNGAIHWAPEAYPPPRPWTHTSDWMQPRFDAWRGPVCVTTLVSANLPMIPEVDAAVSYKVYPGLPYIISTTSMRVNEPIAVQAMRNGEIVFKRGLLTHLAWYDAIENKIQTVSLKEGDIADLDQYLFEADVPWISFFNPEVGMGFGGVQMEYAAAGLEHLPRVFDPYFYVTVGPIIYWARALNFTFANPANQLMVEAPKGSLFWEKWGYVLYELGEGEDTHAELLHWHDRLTNPLRVRLVENADPRVPRIGTEIYIDPSRTGWEDRETRR